MVMASTRSSGLYTESAVLRIYAGIISGACKLILVSSKSRNVELANSHTPHLLPALSTREVNRLSLNCQLVQLVKIGQSPVTMIVSTSGFDKVRDTQIDKAKTQNDLSTPLFCAFGYYWGGTKPCECNCWNIRHPPHPRCVLCTDSSLLCSNLLHPYH